MESDPLVQILESIKETPVQTFIDQCFASSEFNDACQKYESQIYTYFLERDYPTWGTTSLNNPKEYYMRIAAYYGIKFKNINLISGKTGEQLRKEQTRRPFLKMQIGNSSPFEIADVVAQTYSETLSRLIKANLENGIQDENKWIFKFPLEDLQVSSTVAILKITEYFKSILHDNTQGFGDEEIELDLINITTYLQCKSMLCDSLIWIVDQRMSRLEKDIIEHNKIFLEEVDFLRTEFSMSPVYVASYLRAVADLFYRTDNFTEEWIEYFRQIRIQIPGIGAALMPHGYPFTKHQNLDKFDKSLFYVNPFDKPIVMQDYLGGKVCAVLDTSGMDNPDEIRRTRIWRNGKPYPIITEVPNQEEVQARLEKCYSGIVQFFQDSAEAIKREFPNEEAGFILAGGLPSICFDNWLSDPKCYWLFKTDVDLFTYGNSTETRKRIFKILFDNLKRFEKKNTHYYVWNSVFTMFRRILYDISLKEADSHHLEEYHLDKTIQIINTNSRDGFEVIMNFDTSNIQIGWDCHKGWIASPFWSLYTPRREALVVRYNVRSPRFVKTLYRGYNLKIIMPKSLLLMPKGLSYSYLIDKNKLIELIPDPKSTYPDDLKILRHARKGHIDPDYVDDSLPGPNGEVHAYAHFGSQPQGDVNNRKFKIRIDGEEKFLSLGGEDKPLDRNQDYSNLNNVIDRIKYNGKFKNGFDAYVREQYFIYEHLGKDLKQLDDGEWKLLDIKGLTIEEVLQKVGGLKEARFVLRDCKIIFDPKASSTRFHGTDKFKFSLRASILETRKDLTPNYTLVDRFNKGILVNAKPTRNYLKDPHYVTEAMVENNNSIQSETTDLSTYREINKALLRTLYTFPIMMEGIIQIKAENRENSGTTEPKIYYAVKDGWHYVLKPLPLGEEPESEPEIISYRQFKHYLDHGLSEEQAKPRFFKVGSAKADFDIDNIDLHERFYSDEERAALPVYSFDQWQDIRIGKIKLDENVVAIRIRTPVVIKETLFLDQADWTIDVENVLRDYKHLMFNCLCYQNFTTIRKEGITGGEIMVYRSFMIYE